MLLLAYRASNSIQNMKVLNSFLVGLSLLIVMGSCSEDDDYYTPPPSGVTHGEGLTFENSGLTDAQIDVINYFNDIALGYEFGNDSKVTRKWNKEMRVFTSGRMTDVLTAELNGIISEIHELTGDELVITLVDTREAADYHVFIGTGEEYAEIYPDVIELVGGNLGLFATDYDGDNYFTNGNMYVDDQRANEVQQRHLLREEFTQSLGLARDSDLYTESIFQSQFTTTTTSYMDIDRELIRLLYHPDISTGLIEVQTTPVLIDILKAESED